MKLYDNAASGNCLKCRIVLRQLDLPYDAVPVDLFRGETREPPHLARNVDGRVPVLETDDGALIAESGAILLHLAEGSPLLPAAGTVERAHVHRWLLFEQNRIEPELGLARFWRLTGRDADMREAFASRVERGRDALDTLQRHLAGGPPFVAGDAYTIADAALYAYVHCAGDAGVEPPAAVSAWLARVSSTPGFVNDLAPYPPHASGRPD